MLFDVITASGQVLFVRRGERSHARRDENERCDDEKLHGGQCFYHEDISVASVMYVMVRIVGRLTLIETYNFGKGIKCWSLSTG